MKSALKKVVSLMLVAMLLVTAIPFQAGAVSFEDDAGSDEFIAGIGDIPTDQKPGVKPEEPDEKVIIEGSEGGNADQDKTAPSTDNGDVSITPNAGPVMRSAVVGDQKVTITVVHDGKSTDKELAVSVDLKEVAASVVSLDEYDLISIKVKDAGGNEIATVTGADIDGKKISDYAGARTIEITANKKVVKVPVTYGAGVHEVERGVNGAIVLADALIGEAGMPLDKSKKIDRWEVTLNGKTETKQNGATVNATWGMEIKAILVDADVTTNPTDPSQPAAGTYTVKFFDVNGNCHWYIDVVKGSTVGVADNTTSTQITYAEEHVGTLNGYKFTGWKIDGKGDKYTTNQAANVVINANTNFYPVFTKNGSDTTTTPGGSTTTNKFPYKVYLHIYLNNKVDEPARTVNISDGIAVDGVVSRAEVENVVKQYYSAKNSDGIKYDGLYMARGNWVSNFATDSQKYDEITGIKDMRQESEVHINVMVTNANSKSSSNNNSTNPKTGDSIVMTVSALGITASALAAAYYVSKKRMAR